MKRLNEISLMLGDIILVTSTAAVSKAIRTATRSDISHAMIYVEHCSVIDATAEGVQARNTQRLLFEDDCAVYVLRLKDRLPVDQVQKICTFVRQQVGAQYSTKEAVRVAVGGAAAWTRRQFCSRLVAQAYSSVGIRLVSDPNFCSPAEIKNSSLLVEVGNPTNPVSPEEAAHWANLDDVTQKMRDTTNAVLDGIRTKDKNIQNFDDLNRHLQRHPEDDGFICCLLETSGYLTLWKIEKASNPWQYDLHTLAMSGPEREIEKYCWNVLANGQKGPHRYLINRGGYVGLAKLTGLRAFQLLADLYSILADLHVTRIDVATKWLEMKGLFKPSEETCLRPHTAEWFEALRVWDPVQAASTQRILELAGRPNVCSVCGDDPANDYRLDEAYRAAGGVDTLRLCNDCLRIRKDMGEPFAPMRII